jgi:hypothetical protein
MVNGPTSPVSRSTFHAPHARAAPLAGAATGRAMVQASGLPVLLVDPYPFGAAAMALAGDAACLAQVGVDFSDHAVGDGGEGAFDIAHGPGADVPGDKALDESSFAAAPLFQTAGGIDPLG